MCALLRGVFTKKLPQPRYAFTWNVQVVLDFAKNRWQNSNSISVRDLTFNLLILLALTSISRACTIHCLDILFMARHAHFVQLMFGRLHKSWKSGKSSPVVRYYEYEIFVFEQLLIFIWKELSHGGLTKRNNFY